MTRALPALFLVAAACALVVGGCQDDTNCTPAIDCSAVDGSTLTDSKPTEPGIQAEVTCAVVCLEMDTVITLELEESTSGAVRDYLQPYDGSGAIVFPLNHVPGTYTGRVFDEDRSAEDTFHIVIE